MSDFKKWCTETETRVSTHVLHHLVADPERLPNAVKIVANAIPDYYAFPSRISELMATLGKPAVAKFIAGKFPTMSTAKSGDLGEILCTAYVTETTHFKRGIKKFRWKDHRDMSMRGEDLLAFSFGADGTDLKILKAEVKSRVSISTAVIKEARASLDDYQQLPSPHAITFVADRAGESGDLELRAAIDKAQLVDGIKLSQMTHMLFTFSGNNPSPFLQVNLSAYDGNVPQHYVGLQVKSHQTFISDVFEEASS